MSLFSVVAHKVGGERWMCISLSNVWFQFVFIVTLFFGWVYRSRGDLFFFLSVWLICVQSVNVSKSMFVHSMQDFLSLVIATVRD